MVRNPKSDGSVSRNIATSGQQHKLWVHKSRPSADGSGGSQDQMGPRDETSANDELKHNMEKGTEGVVA
jgi:hypothetical protein